MSPDEIRRFGELDIAAAELAGGAYVAPYEDAPDYDIRRLDEYCRARGVSPSDLTEEELKQFVRQDNMESAA